MAAPSSPILPPIPGIDSDATPKAKVRPQRPGLNTRKRTFDTLRSSSLPPSAASSDPALFSGDEDSAAENYGQEKRKKKIMYSGSWFSHMTRAGKDERKREFKRNVDSGVFMAGEESDFPSSDSLGSLENELIRDMDKRQQIRQVSRFDEFERIQTSRMKWQQSLLSLEDDTKGIVEEDMPSSQHEQVKIIIRQHLDAGNEDVELSRMDLTNLPPEIAELATLSTQPNLVPGMLDIGRPFETNLKLMLCNNLIRDFPTPILDVSNLKVLSLRQNKLRSIPSSVRRLTSLVRLSVGGNKLSCLPFEILELAHFHRLRVLHADPNPWDFAGIDQDAEYRGCEVVSTREPRPSVSVAPTGAMSLTESTLRALYRLFPQATPDLDLLSLMPPDRTPDAVLSSLASLEAAQQDGPRLCTLCHRPFVKPGEEWLEYWAIGTPQKVFVTSETVRYDGRCLVPFRRTTCAKICRGEDNAWVEDWQQWHPRGVEADEIGKD
jgi:hypothetical protein